MCLPFFLPPLSLSCEEEKRLSHPKKVQLLPPPPLAPPSFLLDCSQLQQNVIQKSGKKVRFFRKMAQKPHPHFFATSKKQLAVMGWVFHPCIFSLYNSKKFYLVVMVKEAEEANATLI